MAMYPCLFGGGGPAPVLITKNVTQNGTYYAQNEGADGYSEVSVTVQGGGARFPQVTRTLIVDNTALSSSLNFTDLYTNYDFLEVTTYNSSSQKETKFLLTPSMATAAFTNSRDLFNFNEFNTNQYVCYRKTSDTVWTRNNSRNLNIKTIYGLTLTNAVKTESVLYDRGGISSSTVTFSPPTGKTFFDYEYIMFLTCTGNSDETQPSTSLFMNTFVDANDFLGGYASKRIPVDRYDNYTLVTIDETTITASYYCYVVGLNFTYT